MGILLSFHDIQFAVSLCLLVLVGEVSLVCGRCLHLFFWACTACGSVHLW